MGINMTEVGRVYTNLSTKLERDYTAVFTANKIDPEVYARVVSKSALQLMKLAMALVQKQEQLQVKVERQNYLTKAELEKQWGFKATGSGSNITIDPSAADNPTGLIDEQIDETQARVNQYAYEKAKIENREAVELGKQWGYVIGIANGEELLSTPVPGVANVTDTEISKLQDKTEKTKKLAGAELLKKWGYTIDTDADNSKTLSGVGDGIDYVVKEQIANAAEEVTVKIAQEGLIKRQACAYNDKLRIEEAKIRKDVTFGYSLGGHTGGTASGSELTAMSAAINAISPSPACSGTTRHVFSDVSVVPNNSTNTATYTMSNGNSVVTVTVKNSSNVVIKTLIYNASNYADGEYTEEVYDGSGLLVTVSGTVSSVNT